MKALLTRILLRYLPEGALEYLRSILKNRRRKTLQRQQATGGIGQEELVRQFRDLGIKTGDCLLVHSSLSKIGYVNGGAETVIEALTAAIGPEGTLLMPSFPAPGRNLDYLRNHPVFDVRHTPSAMGVITETFRCMQGVIRSIHPTDPVCAKGPMAEQLTEGHFGQPTPYNAQSPFRKLVDAGGKILMLGTTLNGAGTSLHTLEDAVNFPFPVYMPDAIPCQVIDAQGRSHSVSTRVHNPEYSARRNCDALLPYFEKQGVVRHGKVGEASAMLFDAAGQFRVMLEEFNRNGVTMYTPQGVKRNSMA